MYLLRFLPKGKQVKKLVVLLVIGLIGIPQLLFAGNTTPSMINGIKLTWIAPDKMSVTWTDHHITLVCLNRLNEDTGILGHGCFNSQPAIYTVPHNSTDKFRVNGIYEYPNVTEHFESDWVKVPYVISLPFIKK
jgi:hypothetical protein